MRLDDLLRTAHALADAARRISQPGFRRPLRVEAKADGSPVSAIDRRIERILRRHIAVLHPDHGVLGEEEGASRPDAEWLWVLDPIDGTASYVVGIALWGTLIGLLFRGEPVLGVFDAPATRERWSAARGAPAWHRASGQAPARCATRACTALADARLCLPSPDAFDPAQAQAVRRLAAAAGLRRYGGDCHAYGLLASGHLDLVVEAGLEPHDHLPLVPIVTAAGGTITDWSGAKLGVASRGDVVAAATVELHRVALQVLQDAGH